MKKCRDFEVEVQDLETGQRKLGVRSQKKIVGSDKYTRKKMLWTVKNGECFSALDVV